MELQAIAHQISTKTGLLHAESLEAAVAYAAQLDYPVWTGGNVQDFAEFQVTDEDAEHILNATLAYHSDEVAAVDAHNAANAESLATTGADLDGYNELGEIDDDNE